MIPFTDDSGLRDYRKPVTSNHRFEGKPSRWPWLVLVIVGLVALMLKALR
jgi:hypothetical protein